MNKGIQKLLLHQGLKYLRIQITGAGFGKMMQLDLKALKKLSYSHLI